MRVIAGKYKRRNLSTLTGSDITRPTADRVKESLFNIISDSIENSIVLDLFAGSGALGIEALSRGAKKAVFVEKNPQAFKIIQQNLHQLQIPSENFQLVNNDASLFLKNTIEKEKFDIIFIDPPYLSKWYENALQELDVANICNQFCTVIFEMPLLLKIQLQSNSQDWAKVDERKYGKTKIEIWQKGQSE
ncbi:16S rRNA (guanine(966)-N(2))-methyltransferase RsmD [Pigmentibacter sp. JX0631]|uniref:16S rRNA (guanine(966)-N(2))-methyltransferase RsmD n=1 Tax=Pigmentibacter sp. JX0631 TaxID=2976982 RepID=UPI002469420F|nr:16S rRNA (guanine(966)-N(2))-methyltransferase RsmD [Pigmentibacter sp. JX0631]WGL58865.1 16S rRNA (guanine(966)-N(2))-methyltransferase RsmD [Pigmentibacter sp. JX0631]